MGARGFILVLLLFALVGAGAGYGAAQLVPMEEEEQAPETANLVAPGAGGADAAAEAGAGTGRARQTGGQPSVDDVLAASLSDEQRRELESNPEAAAMARAQIQMAIDSGMIPPEVLQEMAGGGMVDAAPGAAPEEGVRNAEPLAGTVVSFEGGTLRLETPDGEAAIAVADDVPVNLTKTVAGSSDYLADGAEVSVVARPDESGALTAAAVVVGAGAQDAGGGRGFGGLAAVVMGTVASFTEGVLTLETADGPTEFTVPDETPVRITETAAEAASELTAGVTVTAFVQREADGSLSAASVNVGGAGGGFGRGLLGGGQGGRQGRGGQGGDGGESGG